MAETNGAGGAPPVPAAQVQVPRSFTVEIATDQNNQVLSPIGKILLRGRFAMASMKGKVADDRFANCPDIPGVYVTVDWERRTVKVTDPLALKKNAGLYQEIAAAVANTGFAKPQPSTEREFTSLNDDMMKTWTYWVRRWLDSRQCVEVEGGRVPSMEAVAKLPGRVERNLLTASQRRERFPDESEIPPYQPPPEKPVVSAN